MAKRKSAIYVRSSKDRHDVSVESQQRELEKFVEERGDITVATFIDKVESAKSDDRPGFQAMIAEAKSTGCRFKILYCFDTSRFSRRQYHAQVYKHLLKKSGIEIVFLRLPKTNTILDPIIESLMEAFDQFHSEKSKADGLRGMRENIKQGWRAGGRALLGYQLEKHEVGVRDGVPITKSKLKPDPVKFHLVQSYLKGRANGESRKALINRLNLSTPYATLAYCEESALTYAGHTVWNRHNEFIDGQYTQGKKYRDRSEWVITHNTHEAMITNEEAEAILKQRNKQRMTQKRRRTNSYLLSGLVKCGCGANMDGEAGYYRCHNRCGNRSVKQERIEKVVVELLFDKFLSAEILADLKNEIEKELATAKPSHDSYLKGLKKELKEIERQISEIMDLVTQVNHKRPLLDRLDNLEENRTNLAETIQLKERKMEPAKILGLSEASIQLFIEQYRSKLESGNPERKKAVIRSLLDHTVLAGQQLTVVPNYRELTGVNLASPRGVEPLLPP